MLLRRHYKKKETPKKAEKKTEIDYSSLTVKELKSLAKENNIEGYSNMKKDELIQALEG